MAQGKAGEAKGEWVNMGLKEKKSENRKSQEFTWEKDESKGQYEK